MSRIASKLEKIIGRFASSYLDRRVILALDSFLSLIASGISLMLLILLANTREHYSDPEFVLVTLGVALVSTVVLSLLLRTSHIVIRHTTVTDAWRFANIALGKSIIVISALIITGNYTVSCIYLCIIDMVFTLIFLLGVRYVAIAVYGIYRNRVREIRKCKPALIYGTSDKALAAISRFKTSKHYEVVGIITPNQALKGSKISDVDVFCITDFNDFDSLSRRLGVQVVIYARERYAQEEKDRLVDYCSKLGIVSLVLPSVENMDENALIHMRQVRIEDLLGRDEIQISTNAIRENISGKTVMVTGAAGSIGSELCRQLAIFGVGKLVLFDNAETPMHNLRLELEEKFPELDFTPVIGDVRQLPRLDFAFRKFHPQIVFHAAAYKHVPLMEDNPCEAVLVNAVGSRQVADKCIEFDVEKMVMISTDKAVNPTNIMGCTKRLAEIYVQSLGLAIEQGTHKGKTKFVTTRFGNVLGSNGSVIPRFREQIAKGGPVTVTHPDITRFFMTIPEACRLVMEAATLPVENRICVFDMGEPVKIDSLARTMISLSGFRPDEDIKIEYVGLRPGEKLYEEVLSNVENTEPTSHDRIRVAKVRSYSYEEALKGNDELERLSREVNIPDMVRLMKRIVPEFVSKNSPYEVYDKENAK